MKSIEYTIVAVVIIGFVFLYTNYKKTTTESVVSTISTTTTEIDTGNWRTYTDEKYGFSYMVPTQNNFDAFNPRSFLDVVPLQFSSSTPDLKSYAEDMWNMLKNEKNPNLHYMPVSEFEQIILNGRTGYRFTRDINFNDLYHDFPDKKYTQTNILTTNQNNQLFWIYYTKGNSIGEKIFSTLKIDANLIAPKIKPDNWQTIKESNGNFEFLYPTNIFTENLTNRNSILNTLGKRGYITVYKFEPSEYEKVWNSPEIKNMKKVKVGNLYGYESTSGEGGSWGTSFSVPMNDHHTIVIVFVTNEDSIYPVADDTELQNQILSTFKFSTD